MEEKLIEMFGQFLDDDIDKLEPDELFILSELAGDRWPEISEEFGPKYAGTLFRKAVVAGKFPKAELVRIRPGGRANEYRRIG